MALLVKGFEADPYFRLAEQEAWLPHGGKPHWGKVHYLGHVRVCELGVESTGISAIRRKPYLHTQYKITTTE